MTHLISLCSMISKLMSNKLITYSWEFIILVLKCSMIGSWEAQSSTRLRFAIDGSIFIFIIHYSFSLICFYRLGSYFWLLNFVVQSKWCGNAERSNNECTTQYRQKVRGAISASKWGKVRESDRQKREKDQKRERRRSRETDKRERKKIKRDR